MALNSRHARRLRARKAIEQGGRCCYCGRRFTETGLTRATIEHRKAKMDGGSDRVANLAAACLHCNRNRGRQMVVDRAKARAAARASRKPGHEQPTPA